MYLFATTAALILGGVFALLVRAELWAPDPQLMGRGTYSRVFTLHGAVMVFLFVIPVIPAAIGNYVLPLMLKADDLALPRLNRLAFHIYLAGAAFLLTAMYMSAADGGSPQAIFCSALGVFVLGFSSILSSINFIVTVHQRAKRWLELPPFVWALYATSLFQALSTPILVLTLVAWAMQPLMSAPGAASGLPRFFWVSSHPAVYIMALPAIGVICEVVEDAGRRRLVAYRQVVVSLLAIAVVALAVWGHDLFMHQHAPESARGPVGLGYLVALPTAVVALSWSATLMQGNLQWRPPLLYALCFIGLLAVGALNALLPGALGLGAPLRNTYFVVAHFHIVVVGGTLMALLAGLYYWWPTFFGRNYHEGWAKLACGLVFGGFSLTFFPQLMMGLLGSPRATGGAYGAQFQPYQQASTVGVVLLSLGLVLALAGLIHGAIRGPRIRHDEP